MATNKRKEAAALFELLDKSTLKVPKAGGNLKIPGWWSSQTVPPPKNEASPDPDVAPGAETVTETGSGAVADEASASTTATLPTQEETVQARMFEPPPADVTPTSSPSIRPPQAPLAGVLAEPVKVSSSPSVGTDTAGAKAAVPSAPKVSRVGGGARASAEGAGKKESSAVPVLLPPTVDPGRKTWSPPRPGTFARVPLWVFAACGVFLLVVAAGAVIVQWRGKGAGSGGAATMGAGTMSAGGTTAGAVPAKVHEGGTVARSKDLYYVVVYTTPAGNVEPTKSAAYKHAQYLASQGVESSVERVELPVRGSSNRTESWYWVVTVKGFGSATEAKPFRDDIVKIGDQMERGAWKGAYARNGLSLPAETAPR